jgi:hypothetical protein
MAKKTSSGKFILKAGEIGTYSLCPESWRLQHLESVNSEDQKRTAKGITLHAEWSKDLKDINFLSFSTRLICYLILLSIFVFSIPLFI